MSTSGDSVLPIIAWCGPSSELANEAIFKDMASAGFTADLTFSLENPKSIPTRDQNFRMLGEAVKIGIKIIVVDSRIDIHRPIDSSSYRTLDGVVDDYKKFPALLGYFVIDEPGADKFQTLSMICRHLRERDPYHPAYINLFPNYADGEAQLRSASYSRYISDFISTVQPQVLSFDNYGILKGKLRGNYFENLELIRNASLAAGIPFWAFTLSTPHYQYYMPDEGQIRFQLFCALAYGAKGLQYFTYGVAPDLSEFALINSKGQKTSIWMMARDVNTEILKLSPILKTLTSIDVFHTAPLPRGTKGIPENFYVTGVDSAQLVIGYFLDREGMPYVLLVNRDYEHTAGATLHFSPVIAGIAEISKQTGLESPAFSPDAYRSLVLHWKPGEGRLFRIVK